MIGPFAGIAERPYDQVILRGVNWYDILPRYVWFSDLWLTQTHLKIAGIFGEKFSTDQFTRAVYFDKRLWLEDGHHRLVLSAYKERTHAMIRVWHAPLLIDETYADDD